MIAAGFANPIDAWKKAEADALRIALGGHATPEDALKAEIAKWKDRQAKEVTDTLKGISGRAYGIPHSAVDALTGSLSSAVADRSIQSAAEDALKDIAGLAKAAPRFGTGKAGSSALGDEIPVPVSLPSWLVQQQFAPAAQQPVKMEPTPASAEEASAWYRLIFFLGRSDTIRCNRENMVETVKRYLDDTKGSPSPSVSLPDVAKAAHPDDEAAAKRLLLALQQAVFSDRLPYRWPSGEDAEKRLFLALLQTVQSGHFPSYVQGDEDAEKRLLSGLEQAAQSGDLPSGVVTHEDDIKQLYLAMRQAVQSGHLPLSVFDDVDITFPDLSAWLAAWPECPGVAENSPLRYWLDWLPVVAPKVAAVPDTKTPRLPTTWSELVAWPGRKKSGFVWTDNLRQIVATEKRRRMALAHTGIAAAMGVELGCSARYIGELITGIGKSGSRKQVLDNAISRMANGTSGKSSR